MRYILRFWPVLFTLLLATGCDSQDPAPEEVWDPSGIQVYSAIGEAVFSEKEIGPFADATRVTFTAQASATTSGDNEGTATVRVLLDDAVLCEGTQQGTGTVRAETECAADFSRHRSKTLMLETTTTNATRQSATVKVEW